MPAQCLRARRRSASAAAGGARPRLRRVHDRDRVRRRRPRPARVRPQLRRQRGGRVGRRQRVRGGPGPLRPGQRPVGRADGGAAGVLRRLVGRRGVQRRVRPRHGLRATARLPRRGWPRLDDVHGLGGLAAGPDLAAHHARTRFRRVGHRLPPRQHRRSGGRRRAHRGQPARTVLRLRRGARPDRPDRGCSVARTARTDPVRRSRPTVTFSASCGNRCSAPPWRRTS